jgi:hypothetical protein
VKLGLLRCSPQLYSRLRDLPAHVMGGMPNFEYFVISIWKYEVKRWCWTWLHFLYEARAILRKRVHNRFVLPASRHRWRGQRLRQLRLLFRCAICWEDLSCHAPGRDGSANCMYDILNLRINLISHVLILTKNFSCS